MHVWKPALGSVARCSISAENLGFLPTTFFFFFSSGIITEGLTLIKYVREIN